MPWTRSDARAVALLHLGTRIRDYDPGEVDELERGMATAVHEAGHHLMRAVLGIPGGDIQIDRDNLSGSSHPPLVLPECDPPDHQWAMVCLAGPLAYAELVDVLWDEGGEIRAVAAVLGAESDLAMAGPPWVRVPAEAAALALIRTHWASLLRVAVALHSAPTWRLTWEETRQVLGPWVVDAGDPPQGAFIEAYNELASGEVQSIVSEDWVAMNARPIDPTAVLPHA